MNLFAGTGPSKIIDFIYQKTFAGTGPSTIINYNFPEFVCWDRSLHKSQFNLSKITLLVPVPLSEGPVHLLWDFPVENDTIWNWN